MCAPVSRFEFSMSNQLAPKMFVRACLFRLPVFISITSHPARLMSWNILRTFFAVANVKRSYKVRSFGRRLLFFNQRAKNWRLNKRRATFGEFEFRVYLLLPRCFKVLTFFFMQIYISK
jgi:hypothetical protein